MRLEAAAANQRPGRSAASESDAQQSRWDCLQIPILVGFWLLGYWAPWQPHRSGTAWLELASWSAAHGLNSLQTGSRFVTGAGAFCAVVGAILRVIKAFSDRHKSVLPQAGLFLTCAPLCLLQPTSGAVLFLLALVLVSASGWAALRASAHLSRDRGLLLQRLMGASFPILSAVCFLTMSWQYNAQWLMRGLLVSAGLALVAEAVFPLKNSTPS